MDCTNYNATEQNRRTDTMKKKKVYLAGPMRGIPEFNFPAFMSYASKLRALGYIVMNPAEMDIEEHGDKVWKGRSGNIDELSKDITISSCLSRDLLCICKEADAVALMPDWHKSKGALAEKATAIALGLEVLYLE